MHLFTFQYGQIYYYYSPNKPNNYYSIYIPIWLDLLFQLFPNLQRVFEIYIPIWLDLLSENASGNFVNTLRFTFQYGQIYYFCYAIISRDASAFTFQYGQIYYEI